MTKADEQDFKAQFAAEIRQGIKGASLVRTVRVWHPYWSHLSDTQIKQWAHEVAEEQKAQAAKVRADNIARLRVM